MATIKSVAGRSIFDGRGNPTVEIDVVLSDGMVARATVPSAESSGKHCIFELIDGGSGSLGMCFLEALAFINNIIGPALVGMDPTDQAAIDKLIRQLVDDARNDWDWCNEKPGINATLAVSKAVCKGGALVLNIPLYQHIADLGGNTELMLPVPAITAICCGSQAGNNLAMQELMILPVGASSFKGALKMGMEVIHHLKAVIKKRYGQDATFVGLDGGFAPVIQEITEGLELLTTAIAETRYTDKVVIGMNPAASEFYRSDKAYNLNFKEENNDWKPNIFGDFKNVYHSVTSLFSPPQSSSGGKENISGDQLMDIYKSLIVKYSISSIEDPFDQDDWKQYAKLTREIGIKVQILGGDLLVTNPKRVERAIKEKTCNGLLVKVNEVGSVTEIIEAVRMSKHAGWGVMTSHCSGEIEDAFIADLSVALATGQIKTGAPCGSECVGKYNQLLRIEEELGSGAVYAGASFRKPVAPY